MPSNSKPPFSPIDPLYKPKGATAEQLQELAEAQPGLAKLLSEQKAGRLPLSTAEAATPSSPATSDIAETPAPTRLGPLDAAAALPDGKVLAVRLVNRP